jgi:cytochrome c biogenesis protein CcdA
MEGDMNNKKKKEDRGFFNGIFLAYGILLLHVLLLILVGVSVVFFRGVVEYMPWILGGGLLLILLSGYLFFRRFRRNAEKLRQVLSDPVFRDRAVEVKLFGGIASLRLGQPLPDTERPQQLSLNQAQQVVQLEDPETQRLRRLDQLVSLLEKKLITPEEFAQLKKDVIGSALVDVN